MAILQYVLPILIFLGAVGCAFIDIKQEKGPLFIGAIGFVILLFLGFNLYLVSSTSGEKDDLAVKVKMGEAWQKRSVSNLQGILATLTPDSDQKAIEIRKLIKLGWTINNEIFRESFAAEEARMKLLAVAPPPNHTVKINNLPININPVITKLAIEELGHMVVMPESEEDEDVDFEEEEYEEEEGEDGEEEVKGLKEANVMFYGRLVRNSDIKLIAYTLIRSGVQLKMLRPYKKSTRDNARSVELDWSKMYKSRKTVTVKSLEQARSFKR